MHKIFDICVSFWQLTWRVMLDRKRRVLFYYPQHFNRTAQATNPFFDRLLETCDKYGISYHLIEEPDWGADKPRNPKAIKGDAFFVLVLIVRKVVNKFYQGDFWQNEKKAAKIVNILTIGRLIYEKYITISGSMVHLFAAMKDKCVVYDMQHGVLYKHLTFFDENERLRPQYYWQNLHWLFWGRGYERCFSRGEEQLLAGRTHVTGYPLLLHSVRTDYETRGNEVLFSLQFTHQKDPFSISFHERQKALFEEALNELKGLGVCVLLKHHPRFNNDISIDDWLEKYDFVEMTSLSMKELLPQVMLQVTLHSTTAFEYAEAGIPSFFIDQEGKIQNGDLFYKAYNYPLYKWMSLRHVVERLQNEDNRKQDAVIVRSWYREFYDDYNEQAFLEILES